MSSLVSLIGAGPGNPELITVLGKRRIEEADIIYYDRLINKTLLTFANPNAQLVDVGKLPHYHKVKQTLINQLLINSAKENKRVVRLKAGDPYIFGRGGEEAQELIKANISFEIVPGITSAIAGPGAIGIPVTHRDFSSSLHIITGHKRNNNELQIDWQNVANLEGTLIFLMGMESLPNIIQNLIKYGKKPNTPIAIVQWATHWNQKFATGTLNNIQNLVIKQNISSPSIIIIGQIVKLNKELFRNKPLQGCNVLIPQNNNKIFKYLQDNGASVSLLPSLKIVENNFEIKRILKAKSIFINDLKSFDIILKRFKKENIDFRQLKAKLIVPNNFLFKKMKLLGFIPSKIQSINKLNNYENILIVGNKEFIEKLQLTKNHMNLIYTYTLNPVDLNNYDVNSFNNIILTSYINTKSFLISLNEQQINIIKNQKINILTFSNKSTTLLNKYNFSYKLIQHNKKELKNSLKKSSTL